MPARADGLLSSGGVIEMDIYHLLEDENAVASSPCGQLKRDKVPFALRRCAMGGEWGRRSSLPPGYFGI